MSQFAVCRHSVMKALSASLAQRPRDLGVVALVDQHPRQRAGVELDDPAAVRGRAHEHVRDEDLDRAAREGAPGLRVEGADLGEHLGQILVVDAAEALQGRKIALRDEVEPRDEGRHRRVEAVLLPELDRQALGEVARRDARGLEALDEPQHPLDRRRLGPEAIGDVVDGLGQVAGLVHGVDEMASDQALGRVDGRKVELRREVVVQAGFARERRLEVRGFAVEAAAAGVRPRRRGERDGVAARAAGRGPAPRPGRRSRSSVSCSPSSSARLAPRSSVSQLSAGASPSPASPPSPSEGSAEGESS